MQQAPQQINVSILSQLKHELDQISAHRKKVKDKYDEQIQSVIEVLLQIGIRYVDESNEGRGPFWTLGKLKQDATWNNERLVEFFTLLLQDLQAGKQYTPVQCADEAKKFIAQYETRKLCLNPLTQCRQKGIEDLVLWMRGSGV